MSQFDPQNVQCDPFESVLYGDLDGELLTSFLDEEDGESNNVIASRSDCMDDGSQFMDWDWSCPSGDHISDHLDIDGLDRQESFDAAVSFDDLVQSEDDHGTSHLFPKPDLAAIEHSPDPRKERKKALKQARLRVITEEDWDDPIHRKLVQMMRLRARAVLMQEEGSHDYLRWFFTSERDAFGLDFAECAISLGAYPDAVRMRFQSYLFMRWIVLDEPIAQNVVMPPTDLYDRCNYYCTGGGFLFEQVWQWPGIPRERLIRKGVAEGYSPSLVSDAICQLEKNKVVLLYGNHCYAVGDYGPILERSNRQWILRAQKKPEESRV